jgi:hypothetical protein
LFTPDPDPIPDLGVKKAPDPGCATLVVGIAPTLLFPVGEVYSVGEDPKDEEQAEHGVQLGVAQQARHHVSKIKPIF